MNFFPRGCAAPEEIIMRKRLSSGARALTFWVAVFAGIAELSGAVHEFRDGDLRVRMEVSASEITTADRVRLRLEADAPAGYRVRLPESLEGASPFRIREEVVSRPALSADGSRVIHGAEWLLEPYLAGGYEISALKVKAWSPGGGSGNALVVETQAVEVIVWSVFPADAGVVKLKALAGPVSERGPWLPIVLALLVLPPLVAALLKKLCGRRSDSGVDIAGDQTSPAEVAIRRLRSCDSEDAPSSLADGVRKVLGIYLREKFRVGAQCASAEELAAAVGGSVSVQARNTFESLVRQLEQARFGKEEGAARAAAGARARLEEFILETGKEGKEGQGA